MTFTPSEHFRSLDHSQSLSPAVLKSRVGAGREKEHHKIHALAHDLSKFYPSPQSDHCQTALLLSWHYLSPNYHHCRSYLVTVIDTGLVCEVMSLNYPWFHLAWEGSRGGLDSCHCAYWLIIIIRVGLGWCPACTLVRDRTLHSSTRQQLLPVQLEVWMNHWFASAHIGYGVLATVIVARENFYFPREGLFTLIILTAGMNVYSS